MTHSTQDTPKGGKFHFWGDPEPTSNYPEYVMRRLLYVGRYFDSFLPGAKRSITKERKRYEQRWPGINAHTFAILGKEREAAKSQTQTDLPISPEPPRNRSRMPQDEAEGVERPNRASAETATQECANESQTSF